MTMITPSFPAHTLNVCMVGQLPVAAFRTAISLSRSTLASAPSVRVSGAVLWVCLSMAIDIQSGFGMHRHACGFL